MNLSKKIISICLKWYFDYTLCVLADRVCFKTNTGKIVGDEFQKTFEMFLVLCVQNP